MNQPILALGVGYEQVQAELKERSRWVEQNLNNQNYFSALLDANNTALIPFGYRMEKVDNNVASPPGTREDEGTKVCPFAMKKSIKDCLISVPLHTLVIRTPPSRDLILNYSN